MPKDSSVAMAAHIDGQVTTLAMLWKLTRVDGTIYYFTDHDADIVYDGGTYLARTGFTRSGITSDVAFSVDNLDVAGLFDSDDIDEDDLRNGLFDGADVKIALINFVDTSMGIIKQRRGTLGEAMLADKGWFKVELRGLNQRLQQNIGSLYSPHCRTDLGSTLCKVGLTFTELVLGATYTAGEYAALRRVLAYEQAGPTYDEGNTIGLDITENANFDVNNLDATVGSLRFGTDGGKVGTQYMWGGIAQSQVIVRYGDTSPDLDIIPLPSHAAALTDIDAGKIQATLAWWQGSSDADDTATMGIEFYDGTNPLTANVIGSVHYAPSIYAADWTLRTYSVQIPATARAFTYYFKFDRVGGSNINSKIDAYDIRLEYNEGLLTDFGDRIMRCTTTGVAPPTWHILGQSYVNPATGGAPAVSTAVFADPYAIFEVLQAWTVEALVTNVTSNQVFRAALDGYADDWFRFGAVRWMTGDNEGRSMEVKRYQNDVPTNGNGTITLFLPMGFDVQVGDRFQMHAGCDKRILTCGTGKFNNAVNFRGEPHVPGSDFLSGGYPDAS